MRRPQGSVVGIVALGVLGLSAGDGVAQSKAAPARWEGPVRLHTSALKHAKGAFAGLSARLVLRPRDTTARELNPWELRIERVSGRRRALVARLPLPDLAAAEQVTYSVQAVRLARGQTIVLFEARPPQDDPAATTTQALWHLNGSPTSAASWKLITVARHSELDGGQTLELAWPARGGGAPTLHRRRPLPGMNFCGLRAGTTIDQERFDPARGLFVLELDLKRLEVGAARATSYIPPAPFTQPLLQSYYSWIAATSDVRNPSSTAVTMLRPLELGDRSSATWWSEGGLGSGRGEFASAAISSALPLKSVRLVPGRARDEATYNGSRRPKRLLLGLSSGKRVVVDLPDLTFAQVQARGGLLIDLPEPEPTQCLTVLILDSYPAKTPAPARGKFKRKMDWEHARVEHAAVSIAEITPLSSLYGLSPKLAAEQILNVYKNIKNIRRRDNLALLVSPYSSALVTVMREQLPQLKGEELARLVPLLARVSADESVPLLLDLFERLDPASPAYRPVKRALAAHRELASSPLLARMGTLARQSPKKRIDAVRLIGRVAEPEDLKGLLRWLGEGDDALRQERIRAMAAGGDAVVELLIAHVSQHGDAAPGADALAALSTIGRRARTTPQLIESDTSGLLSVFEKLRRRRNRMRALITLGTLRVPGGDAKIAALLPDERDPLVRRAAVEGVAYYRSLISLRALVQALKDPSPDVRLEAIRAVGEHPERKRALEQVIAYSSRERWHVGLRAAYGVMAELDTARTRSRLEAMVADRSDPARALLAARALDDARRGIRAELAEGLILDPKTTFALRRKLIELLGAPNAQDTAGSARAQQLLTRLITDPGILEKLEAAPRRAARMRRVAVMSLGQRRDPSTPAVLMRLARDEREDMFTRRTALRALTFFADADLKRQLEAWALAAPAKTKGQRQLRGAIKGAARGIDRRLDLIKIQKGVEDFGQDADRKKRQLDELDRKLNK